MKQQFKFHENANDLIKAQMHKFLCLAKQQKAVTHINFDIFVVVLSSNSVLTPLNKCYQISLKTARK